MFIRFTDGARKGEICDVENGAAVALMKAGRAENPYLDEGHYFSSEAPNVSESAPEPAKAHKPRRGSR